MSLTVYDAAQVVTDIIRAKGKGKGTDIAVCEGTSPLGKSHAIWDHTVLPTTRQRQFSRLYPSRSWYSI